MGNDKFNLIYDSNDLETLKNIAISPCLNTMQICDMWDHYHHYIYVRSVIKNHIKHTTTLPDAQVVNLIKTCIEEIQYLIEEMIYLNRIILTKEMVEAIVNSKMIYLNFNLDFNWKIKNLKLEDFILNNSITKLAYISLTI